MRTWSPLMATLLDIQQRRYLKYILTLSTVKSYTFIPSIAFAFYKTEPG